MKNNKIMPIAELLIIGMSVAAILALVNKITAPIITEREEGKIYESLADVLSGDKYEKIEPTAEMPSIISAVYKVSERGKLKGHIATLVTSGYAGDIYITVGVSAEGRVTKAKITSQSETHNRPEMQYYTDRFSDKDAAGVAAVELFSGATVSSSAIRSAILSAVNALTESSVPEPDIPDSEVSKISSPRSEEEILRLAKELVGTAELSDITSDENRPSELIKLYRKKGGGYVAYIVVSGEYVEIATESLVHFDSLGKIKKLNILTWTVGHGVEPGDFADRFIGKSADNIDGVELVSAATYTSGDLRAAVREVALSLPKEFPIARAVGIFGLCAFSALAVGLEIFYRRRRKPK